MPPEEIRSVEVLNPIEFGEYPQDKEFVLDLKVMLNNDRILNFEVQVANERHWPERSLSYACRTFDQLLRGQPYAAVKPVYHIGFLDYDLAYLAPEFYATFKLLNVKTHELYSDKFILSVVNLNQIELATEEDRKYGIDHWARLFKADTWEAIKKMAQENEYVSDAAETLLQSNQDLKIRSYCEAVEEARRLRRGLEKELELAQATIQDKENTIQIKDEILQAQAAEITRLKALLENK
jgi:predicted transposase/invertase (TIGR01784 family)